MAVVALRPGSLRQYAALYAGTVRKLAAVVYGDRLEHARKKLAPFLFQIVEGLHHAGRALVRELGRDLVTGEPLGQDEDRSLARSGTHYSVHFPVPEGGTLADYLRALFYTFAFRRALLSLYLVVAALLVTLDREVFVCESEEDPLLDITVNGVFALDLYVEPEPLRLDFSQHGLRAVLFVCDLGFYIFSEAAIVSDFQVGAFGCKVGPVFHFAEV